MPKEMTRVYVGWLGGKFDPQQLHALEIALGNALRRRDIFTPVGIEQVAEGKSIPAVNIKGKLILDQEELGQEVLTEAGRIWGQEFSAGRLGVALIVCRPVPDDND